VPLTAFARFDFDPGESICTPRIWIAPTVTENRLGRAGVCSPQWRPIKGRGPGGVGVSELAAGEGILMTTYDGTATRITAARAPLDITTAAATPNELFGELWAALDPELPDAALAFDPNALPTDVEIVGRD
jgi:hypothetical protein